MRSPAKNKLKNKRGNILTENIIFIILNLVFLSILIVFLVSRMGAAAVLEEMHAKQIALMISAAEPGMTIHLDMEKAINIAKKEGINLDDVVTRKDNLITVKLREKGGYSYSFFNDVDISIYPDTTHPEDVTDYVIKINNYKNE